MNRQQVFDQVLAHCRQQGRRAMAAMPNWSGHTYEQCSYRGRNGDKCAVGCLIPDDLYTPAIEGLNIAGLNSNDWNAEQKARLLAVLSAALGDLSETDLDLLELLQDAHDSALEDGVAAFNARMQYIAGQWGLTYKR